MLELGTNHPDFTYPNDRKQAKLALVLSALASIICVWIILAVVA